MTEKEDKITKIIGSWGLSSSVANLIAMPLYLENPLIAVLTSFSIGTVLTPLCYQGVKKLNNYIKEQDEKRLIALETTLNMLKEEGINDRKITHETTNFITEISEVLNKNKIQLENQSISFLNDLLYLINANYYDDISKSFSTYSKERCIDNILNQVAIYIEKNQVKKLDNQDIKKIVNTCYFIKDQTKQQILNEFFSSEISYGKYIVHAIKPKKSEIKEPVKKGGYFDIDDMSNYHTIIQGMISRDSYLKNYGNLAALDWDMEALKQMVTIMIRNYHVPLVEQIPEYSNLAFASSFIYNAMAYAILNHRQEVGVNEMISTFKGWEKIPLELRIKMSSDIIKEMELDAAPFYKANTNKTAQIIQMKKK